MSGASTFRERVQTSRLDIVCLISWRTWNSSNVSTSVGFFWKSEYIASWIAVLLECIQSRSLSSRSFRFEIGSLLNEATMFLCLLKASFTRSVPSFSSNVTITLKINQIPNSWCYSNFRNVSCYITCMLPLHGYLLLNYYL